MRLLTWDSSLQPGNRASKMRRVVVVVVRDYVQLLRRSERFELERGTRRASERATRKPSRLAGSHPNGGTTNTYLVQEDDGGAADESDGDGEGVCAARPRKPVGCSRGQLGD